jgi:hypothetical protein
MEACRAKRRAVVVCLPAGTEVAQGSRPRGDGAALEPKDNPMTTTIIHRVLVVLLLPTHVADQLKYGEAVQAGLTNNPSFPTPDPVITAFGTALTKYSAAETAAQTRAKGTVAARNAARVVFIGALQTVKARVQTVADANPEQAEAIITSAGLAVKKPTARQKQTFAVKYGHTSRTVEVIAKAAGPRTCYAWQYSLDGGKIWTSVPNTMQSHTTIAQLPVATTVEFGYQVTTKDGMGDWSLPTSILVK